MRALARKDGRVEASHVPKRRVEEAKAGRPSAWKEKIGGHDRLCPSFATARSGSRAWSQFHGVDPHEACNNVLQLSYGTEHFIQRPPAGFPGVILGGSGCNSQISGNGERIIAHTTKKTQVAGENTYLSA